MKRSYNLDLARIFLCLCVIALHSINYLGIQNGIVFNIVLVLLAQSNGVFFILSGYFNLEKEYNNSSDIKKFYKNKLLYIVFPFLAFLFVWAVWDYLHVNESFVMKDFLWGFYESVMDTSSNSHLWFMYHLFGLLLATPFLSKMLHNMDKKELKILWYAALGWNAICYFLCYDQGIDFGFGGWFFSGWIIYYFAGYYYRHVVAEESGIKWTILGILGFAGTILGSIYMNNFQGATDLQPLFTIFCMGCLLFWDKVVKITNEKVGKAIVYISRNTFMIYLFHMRGLEYAIRKLSIVEENLGNGLLVVFGAFVFSLIASIVANLCLKPIQKFIDKKWLIKQD